jgi:DtxR family Mn-dependent transcriptional regulator
MEDPGVLLLILGGALAVGLAVVWTARGWVRWAARGRQASQRVLIEDALKHFHHCEYLDQPMTLESLSGAVQISRNAASRLLARLESLGLVRPVDHHWDLTTEGRRDALRMVRVHRLFEKYLAERTGVDEAAWHEEADRREHTLSAEEVEALAATMGDPRFDPHGSPIPTPEGEIGPARGTALATLPVGQHAVIVHVEDEPEAVYAQLVAAGLSVGTRLRMLEAGPRRIRVEAHGDEQVLAPVVAAILSIVPVPAAPPEEATCRRLSELPLGRRASVVDIAPACHGPQRRRLLDLGVVPGTIVKTELRSPGGDPTAYLIRGAVIALRKTQADWIRVRCVSETAE